MGRRARREPAELSARRFDRDLDWRWRRTSYSDITAGAYEARVASEPEERVVDDEEPLAGAAGRRAAGDDDRESAATARRAVAAGDDAGRRRRSAPSCTACFEATDFAAPDLDAELARRTSPPPRRAGASTSAIRPAVVAGLRAAIETPLGPLLGGRALRDIERADRLDELTSSCRWSAATSRPAG